MKYSNIIGLLSCLVVIWACTQKWVYIDDPMYYMGGLTSTVKNNEFGSPGKLHIFLVSIITILFIIPKIWAKRTSFVFNALNVAFAIRNFFAIGMTCRAGECPTILPALYIIFIGSIVIFIMSLLPKIEVKD